MGGSENIIAGDTTEPGGFLVGLLAASLALLHFFPFLAVQASAMMAQRLKKPPAPLVEQGMMILSAVQQLVEGVLVVLLLLVRTASSSVVADKKSISSVAKNLNRSMYQCILK